MARKGKTQNPPRTESYQHPTAESLLRPDVGTQAQFRKKKPHATYWYDSSLDPAMSWDEGNEEWKSVNDKSVQHPDLRRKTGNTCNYQILNQM